MKAPPMVWVYWCRNCGDPFLADKTRVPTATCPHCPFPEDRNVAVDRYEPINKTDPDAQTPGRAKR